MAELFESVRRTWKRLTGTETVYECAFCSLTHEEERLNCPACRFSTFREVE